MHVVRKIFAEGFSSSSSGFSLKQIGRQVLHEKENLPSMANPQDDTYWKKLVDRVREGLRPDFDGVNNHTDEEVAKVRKQMKRRFDRTDSSLTDLHSAIGDIKKHLGI